MTDAHATMPQGFVDPDMMKQILAKAARSYGQILGGAGLINGVMASSWAWAARPVAIGLTVVGAFAILAGLLLWGRNNVSTLRELTATSRTFLGGSLGAWVLGALLAAVTRSGLVWWVLALVLVGIGAWCWQQATRKADAIAAAPKPAGALH